MDEKKQDAMRGLEVKNLDVYYGNYHALKSISMAIELNNVTALIGPSGCGKSTLLRCFNRMNDLIENARIHGEVLIDEKNIYGPEIDVVELRQMVGMVFQKPNPFPKTVFENVAYGLKIQGIKRKAVLREKVEHALLQTALWDEVKDRLNKSALALSAGQQQRLCIARTLAINPSVLLMDEPTSALDPISTARIENLIYDLKSTYTIIIVTHNMQQAARVSHKTAFLYLGDLIEYDLTGKIFSSPNNQHTQNYVAGRFG